MRRRHRTFLAAALLGAGLALSVPAAAQDFLDQAREAIRDAQRSIDDAARKAGRDASEFLADNPDLNRDMIDLGKRLGLPGFEDAGPYVGARLDVTPATAAPGAAVTVTAVGLPGETDVEVGFGPADAAPTVIGSGTTSDRGVFESAATVPEKAVPGATGVFSVETADGRVRLVSAPFAIVSPGPPPGTKLNVTGTLSNEGAECPALRGDDGKLYTLTDPAAGGFRPGDRIHVSGEVAGMSICLQGIPLTGTTITAANG
jgi:hypothetical protein